LACPSGAAGDATEGPRPTPDAEPPDMESGPPTGDPECAKGPLERPPDAADAPSAGRAVLPPEAVEDDPTAAMASMAPAAQPPTCRAAPGTPTAEPAPASLMELPTDETTPTNEDPERRSREGEAPSREPPPDLRKGAGTPTPALTEFRACGSMPRAEIETAPSDTKAFPTAVEPPPATFWEDVPSAPDPCTICLEPFAPGAEAYRSRHCEHAFHLECISLWLERDRVCPYCREVMITEEELKKEIRKYRKGRNGQGYWQKATEDVALIVSHFRHRLSV